MADQFKLARLDWTPMKFEVEKTFLESYAGKPLSIIADMLYKAVFITNNNSGRCTVVPLTEDFPLSKKLEDGSFKLRTAAELIGMDGPRIMKGQVSAPFLEFFLSQPSENTSCFTLRKRSNRIQ